MKKILLILLVIILLFVVGVSHLHAVRTESLCSRLEASYGNVENKENICLGNVYWKDFGSSFIKAITGKLGE